MDYIHILEESALFQGIDGDDLKALLACLGGTIHSYKKREVIIAQGTWVHQIAMVLEGSVDTVQEDFWGDQVLVGRVFPKQTFLEAFVLAQTEPLSFHAIAAEPTKVYMIDYQRAITVCKSSCETHHRMITNLLSIAARKSLLLLRKIDHLTKPTIREKLLAVLSTFAQEYGSSRFTLPYTRQELANYLAVDRSAMTVELGRMQREGLITLDKNTFELHPL